MEKVQKERLLQVFLEERIRHVLEQGLHYDSNYQSALELQRQEIKKLEEMEWSKEQNEKIGKAIDSVNHCSAIYGETAYKQGLQDGMKLMAELKEFLAMYPESFFF